MRSQYAIHVLEEDIEQRKNALYDLDEEKEEKFGKEQVEKIRETIRSQIKELEKAIEILLEALENGEN